MTIQSLRRYRNRLMTDELLNNQRYLMRKYEEQEATKKKFQDDIDRFKELRGEDNF